MAPPGWPKDLPPPGTGEFDDRVVLWLLDRSPADLRTSAVRQMPLALCCVVAHSLEGLLAGIRNAYRSARTELAEDISPNDFLTLQQALEAQGARLAATRREVALVEAALRRASSGANPQHRLD
jgi:hypothetical protein